MPRRDRDSERRPGAGPERYANVPEVIRSDKPALPSETGREEGLAPDEPLSDFEAEVLSHPPGGRPMSDVTGTPEPGAPEETVDGLDPTEEAVRRNAEDRPVGPKRQRP